MRLAAQQVANKAHGHICVCSAIGFRVTQIAISQLWGQELPTKGQLEVTYHHPGRGHKDVFKYLLGPKNVIKKQVIPGTSRLPSTTLMFLSVKIPALHGKRR